MPDPLRGHRRYREARKAWLPTADPTCCLCGDYVDLDLTWPNQMSPTVEHTIPIRDIKAMTDTFGAALDLTCDTTLWRMAHWKCQQMQGASAGGTAIARRRGYRRRGSRDW